MKTCFPRMAKAPQIAVRPIETKDLTLGGLRQWRTRMAVAKRELGRTGLQITTLGYGAMELRGAPRGRDITEEQAETILNKVLDSGINYIDTSIDYGLSEERIGRYISHRRAEYYLASKCGCLVGAPPVPRGQRGTHVFTRDN